MLYEYRALLVYDTAASLDNALHAHQLQGNSETEEAVRLALWRGPRTLSRIYGGGVCTNRCLQHGQLVFCDGCCGCFWRKSSMHDQVREPVESHRQGFKEGFSRQSTSSDGSMIAVTTSTAQAAVFDVSTGQLLLTVEDYSTRASATWGVLSGQSVLFTAGDGAAARAWNPRTAKTIGTYGSPTTEATEMSTSNDWSKIVFADKGRLIVYDTRTSAVLKSCSVSESVVSQCYLRGANIKSGGTLATYGGRLLDAHCLGSHGYRRYEADEHDESRACPNSF